MVSVKAEQAHIAQAAVEMRQAKGNPLLMSLLHTRLASAHARVGDRGRAERSLTRADSAFERASGKPEAWLSHFAVAYSGFVANVYESLGQHQKAADLTTETLEALGPQAQRSRAVYTAQHARALLNSGEVEGAVERAQQALALNDRMKSQLVQSWIVDLRSRVAPYRNSLPAAQDFWAQTRQLEA